MKIYLIIASVLLFLLSVWFFPAIIILPYAALNLAFAFTKDSPRWMRLTLQYTSLALAVVAGVLALFCVLINTPDMILFIFSIPLALLAVHGIIEFLYLRGLPSEGASSAEGGSE
jgi:hypothetical protein